jgi:hypothetical protein
LFNEIATALPKPCCDRSDASMPYVGVLLLGIADGNLVELAGSAAAAPAMPRPADPAGARRGREHGASLPRPHLRVIRDGP